MRPVSQKYRGGGINAYEKTISNTLMAFEYKDKYSPATDLRVTIIDIPIFHEEINKVCEQWHTNYGIEIQRKKFTNWNNTDVSINALQDKTCESFSANTPCSTPWQVMSVGWDGTVVACCYDYDTLYVIGNTNKNTLADLWNGERMRALRQEIRSGYVFNELCKRCNHTIHKNQI